MIDIHSHIIFDVDDGPATIEYSLALISESYAQGVRTIVATSHRRKGMFETPEEKIYSHFLQLKEKAKLQFSDLQLLYGGELYYTSEIPDKIQAKKVPSMAQTGFYLIEFSSYTAWRDIQQALNRLLLIGVTPIVAHIERYNDLAFKKERVQELIDMGCYIQINSAHVLKSKLFGDKKKELKKRVRFLLDEDLVHIVASDMHNLENRRPYMAEAYDLIKKRYGAYRADDLFYHHAKDLLTTTEQ